MPFTPSDVALNGTVNDGTVPFGYAGVLLRPVDLDLFVAEVRRVVATSKRQNQKVIRAGERFIRGPRKK